MVNFRNHMKEVSESCVFKMDGYCVWCGTILKHGDVYYLIFSRWDKKYHHNGWVTNSEICIAESKGLFDEFKYKGVILPANGSGWDASCTHNPTAIEYNGKYYMYYMGNYGDGEYWNHRNNQRIGVAVATHPLGAWERFDHAVIDVSPGGVDGLMVSNPTVTVTPDNKIIMMYKAVSSGNMPEGGAVVCAVATADHPLDKFKKHGKPVLVNPENNWSVEDPFIWTSEKGYYALAKDFQGYFTKSTKGSVALFKSHNGLDWSCADNPLAYTTEVMWEGGRKEILTRMERPNLFFENGVPTALLTACARDQECVDTFNLRIPLEF